MASTTLPGGTFTLAEDLTVTRMGYGAMQLAGPHVFGPPADRDAAVAVLREAERLGINHIDTADFYGPHITNQIIKETLHPYPDDLHIATKVGSLRDAEGNWPQALAPEQLRAQVHDNLDHLGLDVLDLVYLRVGGFDSPTPGSIAEPFTVLAQLQQEGLIKHLGVSTVSVGQTAEAQFTAPVVAVQNFYNLAHRDDDDLIDSLSPRGPSPTCPTTRSAASPHCSPRYCTKSPPVSAPHRWRWRWRGCCSAPPTSCSSPVPHPSPTCARTSPVLRWPFPRAT